jgi:hypothetical protein
MSTRVVNVRDFSGSDRPYIYVGRSNAFKKLRGHVLGNPYPLKREADRAECLRKYADYLARHPQLPGWLRGLARNVKRTGLPLACWCSPKPCHADLLAAMIDRMLEVDR